MNSSIFVRSYSPADYPALLQIQKEAFPPPFPEDLWWSKDHIKAHTETFPEGAMIAFDGEEAAGSSTALLTAFTKEDHTWDEVADNGYIRQSHDPQGDTLYGIDVCVRPAFRGRGIAGALYEARKQLVRELGLKRYVAGCRIPEFHKHADTLDVHAFIKEVEAGNVYDPVLSFMLKQGLQVLRPIPGYLDDEESLHYGVLVEWKNPDYR
ncbi:GNAT family N-acetyltransferase [Alkalicoccus daliensis]|uniref:Acetyltransferase (GNAT) family protein n=1 Tax=Alkalicoccus daliensis TaxID=745820 RepID=A0A1H0L0S9_9BACI|nr:GNAT family N-acetyltransferase [Alkalicoccus daliensis]SDO61653.1 Acetyltransferase (GNAT) family protein [Alkalicoccus daliensis]